jgi:NAD(P)-dependent dehydrogenase (short-subunit alcohol dehydrogenase family)
MESTAVPVAVVTGAAQGIGRQVAEALAAEGYALALTDLREPAETLQAVRGRGAEALMAVGDVTSQADVAALAEQVSRQFGGASVLVNNAGISLLAPAEQTTLAQWRRVLEVNLTGPFLLCQQF